MALWAALVAIYGAFWFALAFAVHSGPLFRGERAAPATQTRVIEAENLRRFDDLFDGDYRYIAEPEALVAKNGRIEMPPRTRAFFLADMNMDAQIDSLLKRFDIELKAQLQLVDRWGVLSPAIVVHEGFASLAGNGSRRYLAFNTQVSSFPMSGARTSIHACSAAWR